jgi:hypothetical protein
VSGNSFGEWSASLTRDTVPCSSRSSNRPSLGEARVSGGAVSVGIDEIDLVTLGAVDLRVNVLNDAMPELGPWLQCLFVSMGSAAGRRSPAMSRARSANSVWGFHQSVLIALLPSTPRSTGTTFQQPCFRIDDRFDMIRQLWPAVLSAVADRVR